MTKRPFWLDDDRLLRDRIPDVYRAAFHHSGPQTSAVDQRLQDRLAEELLQVLTRRAILHPFEHHVTNLEPTAKQTVQSHPARGQIAAVFGHVQHDSALSTQLVEDFRLEERHLASARIGRTGGVKAQASGVPIAGQAHPGHGLDLGHRLHRTAGARRDVDRLDVCHKGRSIANASLTLLAR